MKQARAMAAGWMQYIQSRTSTRTAAAVIAVVLLCGFAAVRAQVAGDGQITALEERRAYLESELGDLTPQEFVELSDLLSDPGKRVEWLLARTDEMIAANRSEDATALVALVRGKAQSEDAARFADRWEPELLKREQQLAPPGGGSTPEQIAARLRAGLNVAAMSPDDRFKLWCQGVSAQTLQLPQGINRDDSAWDWPRTTVTTLANDRLLDSSAMIELMDAGRKRYAALGSDADPVLVGAHQVAIGLLGRALGLDLIDLGLNDDTSWPEVAATLEEQSLWRFAGLARVLEACDGDGDFSAATEQLALAAEVAKADANRVAPDFTWMVGGAAGTLAGALPPFGGVDRAASRNAAQSVRQAIVAAYPNDVAGGFEALQRIKTARAGLTAAAAAPIALNQLHAMFQRPSGIPDPDRIRIVAEAAFIPDGAGGGEFFAVVVVPQRADDSQNDKFVDRFVRAVDATELAAKILAVYEFTDNNNIFDSGQNYQGKQPLRPLTNGRIYIAMDEPLRGGFWKAIVGTMESHTASTGWLVAMPTIGVLANQAWPRDLILRTWYRSVAASGGSLYFSKSRGTISEVNSFADNQQWKAFVITTNEAALGGVSQQRAWSRFRAQQKVTEQIIIGVYSP